MGYPDFFSLLSDSKGKKKKKTRPKMGKLPDLQQANKHEESLVNETICTKNPC